MSNFLRFAYYKNLTDEQCTELTSVITPNPLYIPKTIYINKLNGFLKESVRSYKMPFHPDPNAEVSSIYFYLRPDWEYTYKNTENLSSVLIQLMASLPNAEVPKNIPENSFTKNIGVFEMMAGTYTSPMTQQQYLQISQQYEF